MITARGVTWSVRDRTVVERIDLDAYHGQVVGVLGPNGSGKSSLLRALAGLRPLAHGTVHLVGSNIADLPRRTVARRLAFVEQETPSVVDLTLRQVVSLGRTPFRGRFDGLTRTDHTAIDAALERTGLADRANQVWNTLSGGERQRGQLARALAQEPTEIILDEPTNHLDIRHQLDLLTLMRNLDVTVIAALHDLNLAAQFCDHLVVLDAGSVAAAGTPEQVLTPEVIERIYQVHAVVEPSPHTGRLQVTYLP
ncbi:ABC transporter [Rhodococcus ruber BKS 20-38]|uniref:ABC transporter n=1 Tax=Rhodococcus ruber BKS 20-38 TaxID=1278076 RepID=M2YM53_9NOCA|nr:ABC transporter [Rhodococcus ruber BKS 20-38]